MKLHKRDIRSGRLRVADKANVRGIALVQATPSKRGLYILLPNDSGLDICRRVDCKLNEPSGVLM